MMVAREITRDQYAVFVAGYPDSLVFHQIAWLDVVKSSYRVDIFYLGLYEGNQLIGALPVFMLRKFFLRLYGAPMRRIGIPHAVPVLAPHDKRDEVLCALDRWVREHRLHHFQMTLPPSTRISAPGGVRIETVDNLEIDLHENIDAIWTGLSKSPRQMVRRAIRKGVRLHWTHREEFIPVYSRMLASTYGRQGLQANFPLHMYREAWKHMSGNNMRILFATYKGETIAAIWFLFDKDRCHYWDAASLQQYRDLSAGHLLVWESIRWAKRKGFGVFDMVGTSVGGRGGMRPGIGRFKQFFGAKPVEYHIIYWQVWWLKVALKTYRAVMNSKNRFALRLADLFRRRKSEAKSDDA